MPGNLISLLSNNQWLLFVIGGGALFGAAMSIYFAIRQANSRFPLQSHWIQRIGPWFKNNSITLLATIGMMLFVLSVALLVMYAVYSPNAAADTAGTNQQGDESASRNGSVATGNEQSPTATLTAPTPIVVVNDGAPTVTPTDIPTNTPPPTALPVPPPLPSATPEPTEVNYAYFEPKDDSLTLYQNPSELGPLIGELKKELAAPLQIKSQTADGQWLQICCFNLGVDAEVENLWIKVDDVLIKNAELLAVANPVIMPTPTASATPPNFLKEAGPEFYKTDNGYLTIYAKVFQGPDGAQEPQAGYMLKVWFKPEGQEQFSVRNPTNPGAISQAQYHELKGGVHIFNLKYEFDPGEPPIGKTKQDLLGVGVWKVWLTNAEEHILSEPVTFETNPGNSHREIFIAWGMIR